MKLTDFPWNCEVTQEAMQLAGGQATKSDAILLKHTFEEGGDEKQVHIATVSQDYHLVTNEQLIAYAEEMLGHAETVENIKKGTSLWDGKRFRQRYKLTSYSIKTPSGPAFLVVDFCNSYDGTVAVGGSFNMEVEVCTNSMVVDFFLGTFRLKHIGTDLDDQVQAELEATAAKVLEIKPALESLELNIKDIHKEEMTAKKIGYFFNECKMPAAITREIITGMKPSNGKVTRWDFQQAVTQVLTTKESFANEKWNRDAWKCQLLDTNLAGK